MPFGVVSASAGDVVPVALKAMVQRNPAAS
jgi:hypothetical protein